MDNVQRNEIILKHIRLAFYIATRFKGVDHDDLIDLSIQILVDEVEIFYERDEHDGNVTRYISSRIRFGILNYLKRKKIEVTIPSWDNFIVQSNQEIVLEVRDTIDRCCRNELEKFIFDCKLHGLTDEQISKESKVERSKITRLRNELYSRFRVFWGEL